MRQAKIICDGCDKEAFVSQPDGLPPYWVSVHATLIDRGVSLAASRFDLCDVCQKVWNKHIDPRYWPRTK